MGVACACAMILLIVVLVLVGIQRKLSNKVSDWE